ncbi:MAG: rhomboid family intramembrane serine protease [Thermoactinospora sp.]|nr:rhomboid family intramembrane serine protease [Thermoactinospora sp.]
MRDAAVGHQCVECVREGNKTVRQARTVFGGRAGAQPVVTYALIGIIVAVYVADLLWPWLNNRFDSLGIGMLDVDGQFHHYDPDQDMDTVGIAAGQYERLVTSAFLHLPLSQGAAQSLLHMVLNVYWIWTLGRVVEQALGAWRYTALYLLSAIGGSVLGYLVDPEQPAVGASGAVFGLAAAYLVFARRLGYDATRLLMFFVIWMIVSAGFTSWQGHLGGLLAGGAVAAALAYLPRRQHAAGLAGVLVLLAVLVAQQTAQLTALM